MLSIFIILATQVIADFTLDRIILQDDTEQYHILLTNQQLSDPCLLLIQTIQEDGDFSLHQADGFTINFIQGDNNVFWILNSESLYTFSEDSCPSTLELLIGPFKTPHIDATIKISISLQFDLQNLDYSTTLKYNEYINQNFNFNTQLQLTSIQNELIIEYYPITQLLSEDQIQIIFPYRDQFSSVPYSQYFLYQLLDCSVEFQDGSIDNNIQCIFSSNTLSISRIERTTPMKITVQAFQNPQNTQLVENIKFQLIRFLTSKDYILERKDGLSLQVNKPSTNINLGIQQTNNTINQQNLMTLSLQFPDFLYLDTILLLHFPDSFLFTIPTITIDSSMNTNFVATLSNQIITITNFVKNEGLQKIFQIYLQLKNPVLLKDYNNFYIEFIWNSYRIALSAQQNIILEPLIFKSLKLINQNLNLIQETQYCFAFEIDYGIELNSIIEIQFYSDISFTQNLNADQLNLQRNEKLITITNAIQQQLKSFCINGIINPPFIDMENPSYDFTIKYQGFNQVIDQNQKFIQLQNGAIEIIQLNQTQDKTNQMNNQLIIIFKSQSGLQIGDYIIITLDYNKYDSTFLKNNNIEECELQGQLVGCNLVNQQIQIHTPQKINPKQQITIKINNFITNRSLDPICSIDIQTYHQLYSIDKLPYKPNLSVSQSNQLKYFAISSSNGKQAQNTQLFIYMKFLFPILQTDKIYISLPTYVDCSNCVCLFDNCVVQNSIISIMNTLKINNVEYITIENALNPSSLALLNELQIQVKDQAGYLVYTDTTKLVIEVNKFDDFQVSPNNFSIGATTIYTINFISSIPIDQYDFFILDFDQDYQIQYSTSNEIITIQNQQIKVEFQRNLQQKTNITLKIQNIINPKSLTAKYYYTLSHFNHNNQLLQQSSVKSDLFICSFENCAICYPEYCQQCNAGLLKIQGHCLYDCPEGYFVLNGACKQCDVNKYCNVCSSNNNQLCLQCIDGYQLIDNQCFKIDYYTNNQTNQTKTPNNTNTTQQGDTNNQSAVKTQKSSQNIHYQIGLLNYIQAGLFCGLIIWKLLKRNLNFILVFSIILGFSIPVFRIFSLIFFIIDAEYLFAAFTIVLLILNYLQATHFLTQIDMSLLTDFIYNQNVKQQNYFYLNNILFKYFDFRIICTLKCKLNESDLFNFQFKYNDDIMKALQLNYRRLITILNPLQFSLLITATQIIQCNNYQFEFMLYSSIEWLINMVVFYQLKKNRI